MPSAWVRPQQKPDPEAIPFYLGARESAAQDESGRVLAGRYELVEVLASGGTAVVYTAVDRSTGGEVAVKVLYEAAREVVGAFFGQEGRLAARIQSPHLVHARHFGEEDGRLFIVFDLVPGVALPDLYFQALMPWRELCVVVLQLLAGLDALHQGGIVHRDIKPDNIIVKRTLGDEVHVTLLDLGFAWVPPERNLTGAPEPTRQVFGTDRFIAPELLGGGLPEPRNDLYSVGALMYLMLTAQCVPDLSAAPELMEMPPPRAFVPGLPQSVDDIVMRALSDVEARFASAEEMAAAIRVALSEETASSSASLRGRRETAPASTSPTPARGWHVDESLTEATPPITAAKAEGSASKLDPPPAPPIPMLAPANDAMRETARPRWTIAAGMLVSAMLGGGAVWIGRPAPDLVVAETRPALAVEEPQDAKELVIIPERQPPREAPSSSALSSMPAKSPPPEVLAAGGRSRGTAVAGASPATQRGQSFAQAMKGLEQAIGDCIARKTGKEPGQALDVRVRFDPSTGEIDQVRVLDMGTTNPIAGCVDQAVRGAAPPPAGRPNENFTFFKNKRLAPK
jgi:serine/threonine protein kinase